MKDLSWKNWFMSVYAKHSLSTVCQVHMIWYAVLHQKLCQNTNTAVQEYWNEKSRQDAASKSSLKYLNISACQIGTMHPSWDTAESNQRDAYRATIKAKLLTGTYNLRETVLSTTNLVLTQHVCCVMEILKQENTFLPAVQCYTNKENPSSS